MKTVSMAAARRYARALFDVAGAGAGTLRSELEAAAGVFAENKELLVALTHPSLSVERKKKLVAAVFAPGRASDLLRRLLELLAGKDRLALLPAIATAYVKLLQAEQGIEAAEIISATGLDKEQLAAIEGALKRATGRAVETSARVDASLLGGVLVKIAGRNYDGSVRGRLRALRERLLPATA